MTKLKKIVTKLKKKNCDIPDKKNVTKLKKRKLRKNFKTQIVT